MKIYYKEKAGMKNLFLKPLYQNFEVLTPCADVITTKMGQKGPN